jgi:hypothetical protein
MTNLTFLDNYYNIIGSYAIKFGSFEVGVTTFSIGLYFFDRIWFSFPLDADRRSFFGIL